MSDSFLASMTFASGLHDFGNCDCEECSYGGIGLPLPILDALRERKRARLENGAVLHKRTQGRSLMAREVGLSMWQLIMPLDAEPLIEYGASHRMIWIEQLSSHDRDGEKNDNNNNNNMNHDVNVIQSIGKGIIGSSDEEKSRIVLHEWKTGRLFLVPSNGGKAVGYIHTTASTKDSTSSNDVNSTSKVEDKKIPSSRANEEIPSKEQQQQENKSTEQVISSSPAPVPTRTPVAYATLRIIKVPVEKLELRSDYEQLKKDNDSDDKNDKQRNWTDVTLELCKKGLDELKTQQQQQEQNQSLTHNQQQQQQQQQKTSDSHDDDKNMLVYYTFSEQDCQIFKDGLNSLTS